MLLPDGIQAPTLPDNGASIDPNLQQTAQARAATGTPGAPLPPPPPVPLPPPSASMTTSSASPSRVSALSPTLPKPPAPPTGPATDATPSTPIGAPQLSSAAPAGAYTDRDVQIGSTVLPNTDPRLAGVQSLVDKAAQGLAGVDRVQLAKDMFKTFASEADPVYQASLRDAMHAGAAGGQVGSGQLRTHFGDLALQHARDLQNEQDRLIQGATEGSIADQFNKLGALSGLAGQQFGEGAQTRNELRNERGYQGSLDQQAFERAMQGYELGSQGNPADDLLAEARARGASPSEIAELAKSLGINSTN